MLHTMPGTPFQAHILGGAELYQIIGTFFLALAPDDSFMQCFVSPW